MLRQTAAADNPPLSLDDAKRHLHVEHGDDDELIKALVAAAVEYVEARTTLRLAPAPYLWTLNCWPDGSVCLPVHPIRTVLTVSYIDEDGVEQSVDSALWDYQPTPEGARLWFKDGFGYPLVGRGTGGVRITFEAGFNDTVEPGDTPDVALNLPDKADLAVRMLLAAWHGNREGATDIPMSVNALCDQLKIYR